MPPENTNPNPGAPQQPPQPGQTPFQRRPIQPIAPRPFAAPRPPAPPAPTPQQQPFQPQTQQFRPQPVQQPAPPQPTGPSAEGFARPASPNPPTQPAPQQFSAPAQPVAPPTKPGFSSPRPLAPPQRPTQPHPPIEREASDFKMSLDFQQTKQKAKLPKGVFVLVIFGVAGLAVGIIDRSQHSMIFNAALALDLLLALALFVRKELVHKVALGMALTTVTVSAALALGYRGLTDSTVKAESLFIEEAKKLQSQSPTKQLTHEQQQHLDGMQLQLEAQQRAVGENSTLVYAKYGGAIAAYALVALYLTRPKVKEVLVRTKE